jgi:hypothetical protein
MMAIVRRATVLAAITGVMTATARDRTARAVVIVMMAIARMATVLVAIIVMTTIIPNQILPVENTGRAATAANPSARIAITAGATIDKEPVLAPTTGAPARANWF